MTIFRLKYATQLSAALLSAFALFDTAFATTCTQADWVPGFCDLPVSSSPRCVVAADNWVARGACVAATDGCAAIGGCFGSVPVGHWYPIVDGGAQKRCQCGCFGEETEFATQTGILTGTDLITRASQGDIRLLSLDSLASRSYSEREINGILYGPEREPAFKITTASGRQISLSAQHPVLVVKDSGEFLSVKAASTIVVNDFVLGDDGIPDRVTSLKKYSYQKRMVNFNVASRDSQNHFVSANGIILGDNAWQQRLASVDARILLRSDLVRELAQSQEVGGE
jgi:hypothetical protein